MFINVVANNDDGKLIQIPCACVSIIDFYEGFYREFENCPPYRQGRYSMPVDLVAGYNRWKVENEQLLPSLRNKRIHSQI